MQKLPSVDETPQNNTKDEIESNPMPTNSTSLREEIELNQSPDESGDGSGFGDIEVTNCTCGQNFEQNIEERIINLLTLVNENKESYQNLLNRQSQNASDVHQHLYTELHNKNS